MAANPPKCINYAGVVRPNQSGFFNSKNPNPTDLFPLSSGYYHASVMPMHVVYPRPDTETLPTARHRRYHDGMVYRIPIGVQGGAWPFKYEIVSGPSGATIGQFYSENDVNYGVLSWDANGATGTKSFRVRITDNELNTVEATWNCVLDREGFVFIRDGWQGQKNGTIDEPLEDHADYYKGDYTDATYADKIVVFYDGNYSLTGDALQNGNVEMNNGTKSISYIGMNVGGAIIDCSTAKILTRGGASLTDLFIHGLQFHNARTDVNNAHFFWLTGVDVDRASFSEVTFKNIGPGTVGNDNASPVFMSSTDKVKNNFLYKNITLDQINTGSQNGSYVDMYCLEYGLIEGCYAKNSDGGYGYWPKGTTRFVTVRNNQAWENITSGGISVGYSTESIELCHDHEVCWNRVVLPEGDASRTALIWAISTGYMGQYYNSFFYRNTFVNGSTWLRFEGAEKYLSNDNVIISNNLSRFGQNDCMTTTSANITGAEGSGIVDATGRLISDANRGLKGHEVVIA